MLQTMDRITVWDQLQEARCATPISQGYLRLLSALDTGWTITAIVELSPLQRLSESEAARIDLVNPSSGESQSLLVPFGPELAQWMLNNRYFGSIETQSFFYGS